MATCGIYCIENRLTREKYIGQSKNIERRWEQHKKGMYNSKYALHSAMRANGLSMFTFSILEECSTSLLDSREKYWIDYFLQQGHFLYNIMGVPSKEKYVKSWRNKKPYKK